MTGFNVFMQYDGATLTLRVGNLALDVRASFGAAADLVEAVLDKLHDERDQVSAEYQKPPRPDLEQMHTPEIGTQT